MNDWALLKAYAREGSESSFEQLVNRHLNFVHAIARRHLANETMAEEVTQSVFILLARKAAHMAPQGSLEGWLFKTTRLVASTARRHESRRQRKVEQFLAMSENPSSESQVSIISAILDEAVALLPFKEREAILVRFYHDKTVKETAQTLCIQEEAAKKRIARGIDHLRSFFEKRGKVFTGAVLTEILAAESKASAPAELGVRILRALPLSATPHPSIPRLVEEVQQRLFWTGVTRSLGLVSLLLLIGSGLWYSLSQRASSIPLVTQIKDKKSANASLLASAEEPVPAKPPISFQHHLKLQLLTEENTPLADAPVFASFNTYEIGSMNREMRTDSSGFCEIPILPDRFHHLRLDVSAAGYVPKLLEWKSYELENRSISYTARLRKGWIAQGRVVDESGNGIAGVELWPRDPFGHFLQQRENTSYRDAWHKVRSDGDGYWRFDQIDLGANEMCLILVHPDYAMARAVFGPSGPLTSNVIFTLTRGIAFRGRVTTPEGTPIEEAAIEADQLDEHLPVKAWSDREGYFAFEHLDPGKLELRIQARGYKTLVSSSKATSGGPLETFTLQEGVDQPPKPKYVPLPKYPILLSGTVDDAESGKPIQHFRVYFTPTPGVRHSGSSSLIYYHIGWTLLGESRDGIFEWTYPDGNEVPARIRVEAEGYEPELAEGLRQPGNIYWEVKMRKHPGYSGQVVGADGKPAINAQVFIKGQGYGPGVQLTPLGEYCYDYQSFYSMADKKTRTDVEGRFRLKPAADAWAIVACHDEGCAKVSIDQLSHGPIVLQPWGRIQGWVEGEEGHWKDVEVLCSSGYTNVDVVVPSLVYVSPNDQGQFVVDRAAPGLHYVQKIIYRKSGQTNRMKLSHWQQIEVRAGETSFVKVEDESPLRPN